MNYKADPAEVSPDEDQSMNNKADPSESTDEDQRMNQKADPAEVLRDEDQHILRFLDALDLILRHRETLAQNLSRGWMDIASARYSMGPSRISQALFSLKPSEPSVLVSVLPENAAQETPNEEDNVRHAPDLVFRINGERRKDRSVPDDTSESSTITEEESSKSLIDSDQDSGVSKNPGTEVVEKKNPSMEVESLSNQSSEISNKAENRSMKQKSDALAWFGALVSPHLRTAQCSFSEALEILVQIASAQSTVLREYQKVQSNGGSS